RMGPPEACHECERSQFQRGYLRGPPATLPRRDSGTPDRLGGGRREGPLPIPAGTWRDETRRLRHGAGAWHLLARDRTVSVTFAKPEPRQGAWLMRGPWVSIFSVAVFLLVWFVAAEVAQSRLLPGPVAVLDYIYQETFH